MLKKVSKKLDVTRSKASKHWRKYRREKKHILSLKRMPIEYKKGMINELLFSTRENISSDWQDYRGFKYSTIHKSDISDFRFTKQGKTKNTIQKYYTAKRGFNEDKLDVIVPKLLDKSNVSGVLLIFKIKDEKTGRIYHVSDFITTGLLDRIEEDDLTLYEHLSNKLYFTGYSEYQMLSINLRVIYEKVKSSKK